MTPLAIAGDVKSTSTDLEVRLFSRGGRTPSGAGRGKMQIANGNIIFNGIHVHIGIW